VTTQNAQAQLTDPNSLRSFYKALLNLRNSRPSIAQGSYVGATVSGKTLSYQRVQGAERTVVVLNYGTAAATPTVSGLTPGARLSVLYSSSGATSTATADSAGNASLPAAALSVGVWAVSP
jgi:glycosidase